jgi:hypothetical protein
MSEPVSFWRKVEAAMESKTAFYINTVLMVLAVAGIIGYVVAT